MAKSIRNFRLEEITIEMMDKLIPVLSEQHKVEMNRTKLIELLVADRYAKIFYNEENN